MSRDTSPISGDPHIRSLGPSEVATQDCAIAALTSIPADEALRINIISEYDWLFGHSRAVRHFDMRSFGGNLILVPDVEFRPEIPQPPSS
jgi:hypothetical protein